VVNARYGRGNVLLFAINPIWRGETIGSYPLVFNAILHHDGLGEYRAPTPDKAEQHEPDSGKL
jgi:hypothetical protein